MDTKRFKLPLIIIISIACIGIVFLIFHIKKMDADFLERDFLLKQARHPMVIRGFNFTSYDEGGKNITIKAVKYSIEKMKIAFFRTGTVRLAKFKNAEIDIYVNQVESGKYFKGNSQKYNYSLKEIFTEEALPANGLNNAVSLLFEPIKINFYDGKTLITQIQAKKASIKSKDGNIVFQGNVTATSESRSLSTDRLTLLPDTGEITTNHYFVFKTPENKATGNVITTDLLLNPVSLIKNNYVNRRKYEREIYSSKTEADTLHSRHISDRIIPVQSISD
jgi:lipopolysaccharide export system protein LptA